MKKYLKEHQLTDHKCQYMLREDKFIFSERNYTSNPFKKLNLYVGYFFKRFDIFRNMV